MGDEYELLLWIPSEQIVVYCQDGSGDNLDEDDYKNGYNDYIDYSYSEMNEDNYFECVDGGMYLYNNENVDNWQDKLDDFVKFITNLDECPKYVKLRMEM